MGNSTVMFDRQRMEKWFIIILVGCLGILFFERFLVPRSIFLWAQPQQKDDDSKGYYFRGFNHQYPHGMERMRKDFEPIVLSFEHQHCWWNYDIDYQKLVNTPKWELTSTTLDSSETCLIFSYTISEAKGTQQYWGKSWGGSVQQVISQASAG